MIFQPQIPGGIVATIGDALGGRIQRQFVCLPIGQSAARLHLRIVYEAGLIAFFEDPIGFCKSCLDIANIRHHGLKIIPEIGTQVALWPDRGCPIRQRRLRFQHEGQLFIIDLDQRQRCLGSVAVHRRYRSDGVAHKPDWIIKDIATMQGGILGRVIVLPATGYGTRAPDDLGIVAGDDRAYAGQARGFRDIDTPNPGMGMGTAQYLPIEHAG